jgi:hypothetical protein
MVVSSANQPPDSYQKWVRFSYPTESGSWDAVAVPNWVANQLNAAYSTIINLTMVHFWSIIIGVIIYYRLRKRQMKPHALHPLAPTLWNKRADLIDSMIETYAFTKSRRHVWVVGVLLLVFIAWVGQTAMGILVPPLIIIGNAAPVNPEVIYIPDTDSQEPAVAAARFALEALPALRALGSAQVASPALRHRVGVSPTTSLGKTNAGEEILRIDYAYNVTGADLGVQRYPELTMYISGSCATEYGWFQGTVDDSGTLVDYYTVFDENVTVSVFDGRQPTALFRLADPPTKGMFDDSNQTWAMVVSSIERKSFSAGTDPWYLTEVQNTPTGATNVVKRGRPALSCWEDNWWSYKGAQSTTFKLTGDALPGLAIPDNLQLVLADRLSFPMIYEIGRHLQTSALVSATTAIDQIFDAGASSIRTDFERLVLAAFIGTTNVLTDTTLYPAGSERNVPRVQNFARDASGQIKDGVGAFVIFTPDASSLSVTLIIAIPCLFVGVWLLAMILLYWSPVRIVNALDSNNMHQELVQNHTHATIHYDKKSGAKWNV